MWFEAADASMFVGDAVLINNVLKYCERHPQYSLCFRVIEPKEKFDRPYISIKQAFDFLKRSEGASNKIVGTNDKVIPVDADKIPDTTWLWDFHKSISSELIRTLRMKEQMAKIFKPDHFGSVFYISAPSLTFEDSTTFNEFAKTDTISLQSSSLVLKVPFNFVVPNKFLKKERDARKRFLVSLAQKSLMEANAVTMTSITQLLHSFNRSALINHNDIFVEWVRAKFEVRLIALQFSSKPMAVNLLESSPFSQFLFPKTASEFLKSSDSNFSCEKVLGFDSALAERISKNPDVIVDFEKGTFTFRSKSTYNSSRPHSSKYYQHSRPSHNNNMNSQNRSFIPLKKNASNFKNSKGKPFRSTHTSTSKGRGATKRE